MLHSVHVHLTIVLLLTVCVDEVILMKCFRLFAVLKMRSAFRCAGIEIPKHRPPGEQKARRIVVQAGHRFLIVDFPVGKRVIRVWHQPNLVANFCYLL